MNSLVEFWRELDVIRAPFIHPRDLEACGDDPEFANKGVILNHKLFVEGKRFPGDSGFHLSLLPVPYVGDLDNAVIFILLLNPGFNLANYLTMQDPEYYTLSVRNLQQDFKGTDFPFMALNPALATSGGFQWWHGKLAEIIKCYSEQKKVSYLDAMQAISKRIAAIEMMPYRSKSFSAHRLLKKLPSAIAARDFVQGELLARARNGAATLIVTRQAREWGLKAPDAVVYEGGHTRGAHLGPRTPGGAAIMKRLGLEVSPA